MLRRILPALVLLTLPVAQAQAPPPAVQEAILVPDVITIAERMGRAVAYDGTRIAVSAPSSWIAEPASGVVFIYEQQGGAWTQTARLLSPDAESNEQFGYSIALAGDRIVIGAPGDTEGAPDDEYGAAFVYDYDGSEWQMTERLTEQILTNDGDAEYGYSVAFVGDRVFVGAPEEGADGREGAVYVYLFDGAGWVREARLVRAAPSGEAFFGGTLSASGDRVLIGAPLVNTSGAAFIFRRDGASWTQESRLTLLDPQFAAQFGFSVSLDGDLALVGAPGLDESSPSDGAAFVFERSGTAWGRSADLSSSTGPNGRFGRSVALDGTVAVVGASGVDDSTGRAYVFERADGDWGQREVLFAADGAEFSDFGVAVAYRDGRAVVGAPRRDIGEDEPGAAYVFGSVLVDDENTPESRSTTLSAPAPNPSRGTARLMLTLDAPEAVRAVLMDALGREVAMLLDGVAVGETELRVNTSSLPAGVYVVRVFGETVSATRRLTVVR